MVVVVSIVAVVLVVLVAAAAAVLLVLLRGVRVCMFCQSFKMRFPPDLPIWQRFVN